MKVLINGQTGDVAINSIAYLKTEKRLAFEKTLYSNAIQNNSGKIAFLGTILILALIIGLSFAQDKISGIAFGLECVIIFGFLIVPFIIFAKIRFNKKIKRDKHIKNIIYCKDKKLNLWDEVVLVQNGKIKKYDSKNKFWRGIAAVCGLLMVILILLIFKSVMPFLFNLIVNEDIGYIVIVIPVVASLLWSIIVFAGMVIRFILELSGKL